DERDVEARGSTARLTRPRSLGAVRHLVVGDADAQTVAQSVVDGARIAPRLARAEAPSSRGLDRLGDPPTHHRPALDAVAGVRVVAHRAGSRRSTVHDSIASPPNLRRRRRRTESEVPPEASSGGICAIESAADSKRTTRELGPVEMAACAADPTPSTP